VPWTKSDGLLMGFSPVSSVTESRIHLLPSVSKGKNAPLPASQPRYRRTQSIAPHNGTDFSLCSPPTAGRSTLRPQTPNAELDNNSRIPI
jgi:hypothetical protein